jgi:hypothetical protein
MSEKHNPHITSTPKPEGHVTTAPPAEHEASPPHGTVAEEADHAQHSSHDPFARRVAITMVVIAAVLAGVKVLGHRAHNDTLHYNIKAGETHTQADTLHTRAGVEKTEAAAASTNAANKWAHFQAKKLREHFYETQSEMLLATGKQDDATINRVKEWKANAARYKSETEPLSKEAKEYEKEEKEHRVKAKELEHEAEEKAHEAEHLEKESEHAHHQSDRYDLGEMGVELALVLCSIAILTKWPAFWYGGIALGAVGAIVGAMGLLLFH